jgi:uncharacterized protein (TIGR03435 family)
MRTAFIGILNPTPEVTEPHGSASGHAQAITTLFIALEEQLGLKLVAKKLSTDLVVIDRLEKSPTEN